MKPTVETTQSVLGYRQWQTFAFQPYATNDPTFWIASPLPAGLAFSTATGRISGAARVAGVYVFALRAGNADGTSDPVVFTLGIEPSANVRPSGVVEIYIDLLTRLVSLDRQQFGDAGSTDTGPLLWAKRGDDLVFHIMFLQGGVGADLDLVTLKFALKAIEPEQVLCEGTQFHKIGEGESAAYRLHLKLAGPALDAVLADSEAEGDVDAPLAERLTLFNALGEFEWVENNPYDPAVGTAHLRSTSRTFLVQVARDLIADTAPLT